MNELLSKYINELKEIWHRLTKTQKIFLGAIVGFFIIIFLVLLLWSGSSSYKLLYSNLSTTDLQKIQEYLDSKKIEYKIEDNGTSIYVKGNIRDKLRIEISDHFPKFDLKGWELFDNQSIGLTDFTQKVNYKRALEGELARTINHYEQIKYSKVFLTIPNKSLFVEEEKEPTAAVNIMLKNPRMGASKELVSSIQLLVARSVEGLKPENVVISDFYGKLLTEDIESDPLAKISATQFKIKKQVEEALEKKAQAILDKMLGKGNSIVKISAELDFDQVNKHIESYDPDRVATRSEESNNEQTGETESVQHTITNYEINRVVENVVNSVGDIKRLTVSVSLNYKNTKDQKLIPFEAQELSNIENIVKNSVGFDEKRNDQIVVTSYPFDTSVMEKELAEIKRAEREQLILSIAKRFFIVISLLIIILFLRNLIKQFVNKYLAEEEEEELPAIEEEPIIEPELLEMRKRKEEFLNQVLSLSETTPEEIAKLLRTWLLEDIKPGE